MGVDSTVLVKVKISKKETVKIAKDPDGVQSPVTIFSFEAQNGKEIELSEKDFNYCDRAMTMFVRAQEILKKAYEGA